MDALTHFFLPLAIVLALRSDLFTRNTHLLIGFAGLAPDFDKLLGITGAFHSLLFLIPLSAGILVGGRWLARREVPNARVYSAVIVLLLAAHLVLDFVDGGPVPFLYPLVDVGIGLEYPFRILLGDGAFNISFEGPFLGLRVRHIRCYHPYRPFDSFGVTSVLVFGIFYSKFYREGEEARN